MEKYNVKITDNYTQRVIQSYNVNAFIGSGIGDIDANFTNLLEGKRDDYSKALFNLLRTVTNLVAGNPEGDEDMDETLHNMDGRIYEALQLEVARAFMVFKSYMRNIHNKDVIIQDCTDLETEEVICND